MSLIDFASGASVWRGYDYYRSGKVLRCMRTDGSQCDGEVSGSNGEVYRVRLDLARPRNSECTCPHAEGKLIVCKHKVALYFTEFPEEAEKYYHEVIEAEERAEACPSQPSSRARAAAVSVALKMITVPPHSRRRRTSETISEPV